MDLYAAESKFWSGAGMSAGSPISGRMALRVVRLAHTLVWAFFASLILTIPILALSNAYGYATALVAIVLVEVVVLATNGWRCPVTGLAARFTEERADNFDIYLPAWLARHNKSIFGSLYVLGVVLTGVRWALSN